MSARQESIQRLLEAEESAQQIVNAARKRTLGEKEKY